MKSYITVNDGTELFYRDWGSGPTLLFIASWGFTSDAWCYQMLPLSEQGYRCVAFDRRGHGKSSDPGKGYDYDALAEDLHSLIQDLGLSDVVLVGHAMGCGEITRYLSRHGSKVVKGAIYLGTATPMLLKSPSNLEGFTPEQLAPIGKAIAQNLPKWIDDNLDPFFVVETPESVKQWARHMIMSVSLQALIQTLATVIEADLTQEVAKIDVPTLIIHGDHDASQPIHLTADKTAELIPDSQYKIYKGAPNGLIFTHAEQVVRDIMEFTATL